MMAFIVRPNGFSDVTLAAVQVWCGFLVITTIGGNPGKVRPKPLAPPQWLPPESSAGSGLSNPPFGTPFALLKQRLEDFLVCAGFPAACSRFHRDGA